MSVGSRKGGETGRRNDDPDLHVNDHRLTNLLSFKMQSGEDQPCSDPPFAAITVCPFFRKVT